MSRTILLLHIPNTWNCVQSALYELQQGRTDRAIHYLEGAKKSLKSTNLIQAEG